MKSFCNVKLTLSLLQVRGMDLFETFDLKCPINDNVRLKINIRQNDFPFSEWHGNCSINTLYPCSFTESISLSSSQILSELNHPKIRPVVSVSVQHSSTNNAVNTQKHSNDYMGIPVVDSPKFSSTIKSIKESVARHISPVRTRGLTSNDFNFNSFKYSSFKGSNSPSLDKIKGIHSTNNVGAIADEVDDAKVDVYPRLIHKKIINLPRSPSPTSPRECSAQLDQTALINKEKYFLLNMDDFRNDTSTYPISSPLKTSKEEDMKLFLKHGAVLTGVFGYSSSTHRLEPTIYKDSESLISLYDDGTEIKQHGHVNQPSLETKLKGSKDAFAHNPNSHFKSLHFDTGTSSRSAKEVTQMAINNLDLEDELEGVNSVAILKMFGGLTMKKVLQEDAKEKEIQSKKRESDFKQLTEQDVLNGNRFLQGIRERIDVHNLHDAALAAYHQQLLGSKSKHQQSYTSASHQVKGVLSDLNPKNFTNLSFKSSSELRSAFPTTLHKTIADIPLSPPSQPSSHGVQSSYYHHNDDANRYLHFSSSQFTSSQNRAAKKNFSPSLKEDLRQIMSYGIVEPICSITPTTSLSRKNSPLRSLLATNVEKPGEIYTQSLALKADAEEVNDLKNMTSFPPSLKVVREENVYVNNNYNNFDEFMNDTSYLSHQGSMLFDDQTFMKSGEILLSGLRQRLGISKDSSLKLHQGSNVKEQDVSNMDIKGKLNENVMSAPIQSLHSLKTDFQENDNFFNVPIYFDNNDASLIPTHNENGNINPNMTDEPIIIPESSLFTVIAGENKDNIALEHDFGFISDKNTIKSNQTNRISGNLYNFPSDAGKWKDEYVDPFNVENSSFDDNILFNGFSNTIAFGFEVEDPFNNNENISKLQVNELEASDNHFNESNTNTNSSGRFGNNSDDLEFSSMNIRQENILSNNASTDSNKFERFSSSSTKTEFRVNLKNEQDDFSFSHYNNINNKISDNSYTMSSIHINPDHTDQFDNFGLYDSSKSTTHEYSFVDSQLNNSTSSSSFGEAGSSLGSLPASNPDTFLAVARGLIGGLPPQKSGNEIPIGPIARLLISPPNRKATNFNHSRSGSGIIDSHISSRDSITNQSTGGTDLSTTNLHMLLNNLNKNLASTVGVNNNANPGGGAVGSRLSVASPTISSSPHASPHRAPLEVFSGYSCVNNNISYGNNKHKGESNQTGIQNSIGGRVQLPSSFRSSRKVSRERQGTSSAISDRSTRDLSDELLLTEEDLTLQKTVEQVTENQQNTFLGKYTSSDRKIITDSTADMSNIDGSCGWVADILTSRSSNCPEVILHIENSLKLPSKLPPIPGVPSVTVPRLDTYVRVVLREIGKHETRNVDHASPSSSSSSSVLRKLIMDLDLMSDNSEMADDDNEGIIGSATTSMILNSFSPSWCSTINFDLSDVMVKQSDNNEDDMPSLSALVLLLESRLADRDRVLGFCEIPIPAEAWRCKHGAAVYLNHNSSFYKKHLHYEQKDFKDGGDRDDIPNDIGHDVSIIELPELLDNASIKNCLQPTFNKNSNESSDSQLISTSPLFATLRLVKSPLICASKFAQMTMPQSTHAHATRDPFASLSHDQSLNFIGEHMFSDANQNSDTTKDVIGSSFNTNYVGISSPVNWIDIQMSLIVVPPKTI